MDAPVHPSVPASLTSPHDPLQAWLFWSLGALWLLGALLLAGRMIWDHRRLWHIVRNERMLTEKPVLELIEDCRERLGISTMVCLVATNAVQSPALFGCVRPRLLLPAGLIHSFSKRQLRHVFLHELAHLKRHDIAVNWVVAVCQILHWFNPLVWFSFHLMRADREMACDQLALSHLKPAQSRYYGLTIIRLLERHAHKHRLAALASISQDPAQLKRRIKTIAQFKSYAEKMQIGPILIMALLAIMGLTNAQPAQINDVRAGPSVSTPLYPPPPAPAAVSEKVQASMAFSASTPKTEVRAPAPVSAEGSIDLDEAAGESILHADVHHEEPPPLAQEQIQMHHASPRDSNSPEQAWGVMGGGVVEMHGQSSRGRGQQQAQIRVQGHSSGRRSTQSSQGFIKMFGGDINGSVLGVLNAREFGLGRQPKSSARMLQAMVPPTWPGFVQHVEFRLLQINQLIHHNRNGARSNTVQRNLAFLVNLTNCLCAALNTNVNGHSVRDQGSPAFPDIYLQRLRHSLESTVTDSAQLIQLKKHSLRMNQFSQRLYNALDRGAGSGPQRLHQNLLEEWAALKSIGQAQEVRPGHPRN